MSLKPVKKTDRWVPEDIILKSLVPKELITFSYMDYERLLLPVVYSIAEIDNGFGLVVMCLLVALEPSLVIVRSLVSVTRI